MSAIRIVSTLLYSHQMASLLSLDLGTTPYVSGTRKPDKLSWVHSKGTQTASAQSQSPATASTSLLDHTTIQSESGQRNINNNLNRHSTKTIQRSIIVDGLRMMMGDCCFGSLNVTGCAFTNRITHGSLDQMKRGWTLEMRGGARSGLSAILNTQCSIDCVVGVQIC